MTLFILWFWIAWLPLPVARFGWPAGAPPPGRLRRPLPQCPGRFKSRVLNA